MGGTCGTYGRNEQEHTGFCWRKAKERNHVEDKEVGGMDDDIKMDF